MTAPLRSALREAALDAADYDVLEAAIALGRRRQRWAVARSAFVVVAVVLLASLVAAPLLLGGGTRVADRGAPTIPLRIGPPAPFTRLASSSPPGAASVLLSGDGTPLTAVAASGDTYRVIDGAARAGWDALLSPTGDRVAYTRGRTVSVLDLVHGGTRSYDPTSSTVDDFAPEAWLPDGTGLVVVETTYADDPTIQGTSKRLSILDLSTGALHGFADATWPIATPGFAVAVSPDGSRIAYQYSTFITIFDRATSAKTRFDLASYNVLAGRAAWAPDGSLALLHQEFQTEGDTWQLRLVDPASGTERRILPIGGRFGLVRLIGWNDGDPVVVGYERPFGASLGSGANMIMISGFDGKLGVYVLSGDGVRTLVEPTRRVSFIDVTPALLAAPRSRPGDPPFSVPLSDPAIAVLSGIIVLALAIVVWILLRGYRRRPEGSAEPCHHLRHI